MNTTNKKPIKNRQAVIASSFGRHVDDYDQFADVQKITAANLAAMLPEIDAPDILEIGCGTGFLTEHLTSAYPDGAFLVTDLCPEMLASCQQKFVGQDNVSFQQMDGETPELSKKYDLIVSSLTVQWFSDPITNLRRLTKHLKPGGELYYATLGNQTFEEWRGILSGLGLSSGFLPVPDMPGLFEEEFIGVNYEGARHFLTSLKAIGAGQPRAGYKPMAPVSLRQAVGDFNNQHPDGKITWHIAYGRLDKSV